MHDFFHTSKDDVQEVMGRFEKMLSGKTSQYFDVHEVESLYDYFVENDLLDLAEKIIAIGLKQHPKATGIMARNASLLTDKGLIQEALHILESLVLLDSNNSEIFINLGWVYLRKGEKEKALRCFDQAIELADDEPEELLMEVGYNLNQNGFYQDALPYLQGCIKLRPNFENALFELAFAYDKLDNLDLSVLTYEQLLHLNPFYETAWYNIGIQYNKLERFSEALEAYDFAIAIRPDYSEAYFNKGNTLISMARFEEAMDAYIDHLSMSNDRTPVYQYIGDCWEQLGDGSMAIRFFELALHFDGENPDIYYGYGTALLSTGEIQKSIEMLYKALAINSFNPDYFFALAQAYLEHDQVKRSIQCLESGLALSPDEILAWIELFKMKMVTNQRFNHWIFLKKMRKEYGADNPALLYMEAYLNYYADGDVSKTKLSLLKAFKNHPLMLEEITPEIGEMLYNQEIQLFLIAQGVQ